GSSQWPGSAPHKRSLRRDQPERLCTARRRSSPSRVSKPTLYRPNYLARRPRGNSILIFLDPVHKSVERVVPALLGLSKPQSPGEGIHSMKRVAVLLLAALGGLNFSYPQSDKIIGDDLLTRIEQGRERLKKERDDMMYGVVGTRRVKIGRRRYKDVPITGIVGREMALAVLDSNDRISVARAVKRDNSLEVLTPGFVLSLRRDNGINSDIQCIEPAGGS